MKKSRVISVRVLDDVKEKLEDEELKTYLQNFGLNQDEIVIYLGLLKMGQCKVRQICDHTHINRIKGYRILEKLKKNGFVSSTFSNPTFFNAVDLKKSLQEVISRKKFDLEHLEKLKPLLCENYEKLNYDIKKIDSPQFTIISGRSNIYSQIAKMIKEAKNVLYISTTLIDLATMYYTSIPESIQKTQQNGIDIRFVTELDKNIDFDIIHRMKINNIRIRNLPSKGRIVCGHSETLMSGYTDQTSSLNSQIDSALLTNSSEFVSNMTCLSKQMWKSGKPFDVIKERVIR